MLIYKEIATGLIFII